MPKARKKPRYTARSADRHELYQLSVQAPDYEVSFLNRVYRAAYKARPLTMREDFCGTALLSAAWAKSHPERTATGVDIDRPTLDWGLQHNVEPLGAAAERVTLTLGDVRTVRKGKFQIVNALNFSYWIFETRAGLCEYFKVVRRSLTKDGLFLCDAYGGWESHEPMLEPRRIPAGFTYIWDQNQFDPITGHVKNHIHFEFKDGTRLEKAFTYEWRFWTLPEIRELLLEAGFSRVLIYWDQAKSEDEEQYRPTTRAENQPGWLAYIVALP